MLVAAQSAFSSSGIRRGEPPELSMTRSESEVHFNALVNPLNLGKPPFPGYARSRHTWIPDQASRMGRRIRPSNKSIRTTRGNRRNRPGGNGPSDAERAGDRKRPHQALRPSSSDIISSSVGPQRSATVARNLGRSPMSGNGSPPDALIEKRDGASAMALSLPAMWRATTVH